MWKTLATKWYKEESPKISPVGYAVNILGMILHRMCM